MENVLLTIVLASIGWTLLLTVAFVGAVLAVNSRFDALQNLILQNMSSRQDEEASE